MPTYNRTYLQNLCNDVNLVNMDEDDKIAIIQTMKTVHLSVMIELDGSETENEGNLVM